MVVFPIERSSGQNLRRHGPTQCAIAHRDRAIQYSEASVSYHWRLGLLDARLRGHDEMEEFRQKATRSLLFVTIITK
jgi:hypothetical protein